MNRRNFIQQIAVLTASGLSFSQASIAGQKNSTGVVLDPLFLKHDYPSHPENANRLKAIDEALTKASLWQSLTPIGSRKATREEIQFAHKDGYIEEIKLLSEAGGGFYEPWNADTYLNTHSYDAALMAAGSNINLNLAIYDRKVSNGFALLRPPGHHALENQAMGFCIFNSDVIAARALQKYRGVERVAIVDFDVHHGNGTQDMVESDPSIMALSIHQHPFWPMTGKYEFTGKGEAEGTIVNCPFIAGAGNKTYLQTFDEIIIPKLEAFKPQQIIVFAGYDAHWQDPLANHNVSVTGFSEMSRKMIEAADQICDGRISFSLGGGYKLEPLAESVTASMYQLLRQPEKVKDTIGESNKPEKDFSEQIAELRAFHLK